MHVGISFTNFKQQLNMLKYPCDVNASISHHALTAHVSKWRSRQKQQCVNSVAPAATIGILFVICNGAVIFLNFGNAKKCEIVDFVVRNII